MTQFCYITGDEEEAFPENRASPSKVLRLSLTDIARPSGILLDLRQQEQYDVPLNTASSHIAKITPTQGNLDYIDESPSKPQLTRTKTTDLSLRRSKRIRHSHSPEVVRQTPMGLPKPLRMSKKEFTVEEIYLNKNYKTPPEKHLETIFEFPKENRDGSVMTHAKTRKKRKCVFSIDFSKKTSKGKKRKGFKRKRLKIEGNVDEVLQQKLSSLDKALALADLSP